jgi:hypothetical protein
MMMNLETFFQEKQIPYTQWEIEHNGQNHFIDSDVVIEAILATKGMERSKIAGTLFALDFKNASIVDYLRFLAECMIKEQFNER